MKKLGESFQEEAQRLLREHGYIALELTFSALTPFVNVENYKDQQIVPLEEKSARKGSGWNVIRREKHIHAGVFPLSLIEFYIQGAQTEDAQRATVEAYEQYISEYTFHFFEKVKKDLATLLNSTSEEAKLQALIAKDSLNISEQESPEERAISMFGAGVAYATAFAHKADYIAWRGHRAIVGPQKKKRLRKKNPIREPLENAWKDFKEENPNSKNKTYFLHWLAENGEDYALYQDGNQICLKGVDEAERSWDTVRKWLK